MTDIVDPSLDREPDADRTARVIKWAGGADPGWVAPASESFLADEYSTLDGTVLNAFASTHSSTSLTVTIDAGEGFIGGAYCARDISTDVALASSTSGQTVYAGYNHESNDTLTLGLDADFSNTDSRIPLHTYDTDGSGVIGYADERALDYRIQSDDVEATKNFAQGDSFSQYPIRHADVGTPVEPIYGDGSDGAVTHSADATAGGIVYATDFIVESGVTLSVSSTDGFLLVLCQGTATINGTIDGNGAGGAGGAGGTGSSSSNQGQPGAAASLAPLGQGGAGPGGAGDGGDGDLNALPRRRLAKLGGHNWFSTCISKPTGGAGGGGGGFANGNSNSGANGGAPGGGGEETYGGSTLGGANGGDGGDGGALVTIVAQEIRGSGTITCDGLDGLDGEYNSSAETAGGGGGGGSGGAVILSARAFDESITTSVTAGVGGVGPSTGAGVAAGDGADGEAGVVRRTGEIQL